LRRERTPTEEMDDEGERKEYAGEEDFEEVQTIVRVMEGYKENFPKTPRTPMLTRIGRISYLSRGQRFNV